MTILRDRLNESLKEALLAKEELAVSTIRLVLAALKDRDIAERSKGNVAGIGENDIAALLQSMVRQRQDSIEMYVQGGRTDLAAREEQEIQVIQRFLPPQMTAEDTSRVVDEVVDEVGATSLKDMGRIMGILRERYAGQMDFTKASTFVKGRLA